MNLPSVTLLSTALLYVTLSSAQAQKTSVPSSEPDIRKIVREIEAARIQKTVQKLVSFGTRSTLSSQDNPVRGIGAARNWLTGEFRKIAGDSDGRLTVEQQGFTQPVAPRIPTPTTLTNIVATLRGGQPASQERWLVVSGHYDSICTNPTDAVHDAPGANDDASGVAAVLEMARVLSRYRFPATIIFMAVAGEEQGLFGSAYFAEQAKKEHRQIEAMFTNDIIGGTTGGNGIHEDRSVRVFSEGVASDETEAEARLRRSVGGENDAPSRQLARFIRETARKYLPRFRVDLIYRRDRYLRGGDHIPFLERGFPAVRFTEPNENYHHQHQDVRTENGTVYGDLPEFVDFDYVAQVTRVNAASLAALALAPAPPQGVGLVTRRLTPDTELQWTANKEPDLAGYEIVWRDTTASFWTHARSVGRGVTAYTLKGLSKDNVLFGVRALSKEGYRSPVAFPRPIR